VKIAVGVDAGGSSTTAVASVNGKIGQPVTGGPANIATDFDTAVNVLHDVITRAASQGPLDAVVIGAAGAGSPNIASRLETALRQTKQFATYIEVCQDTTIALRAAIPEGDGIVVIAGTGSIAYAEIDGERYRSGGYGYVFGDEGSGFAIGCAAVQYMLRAEDGRVARDRFVEDIARAVRVLGKGEGGSMGMRAIVRKMYSEQNPVPGIASLASLVIAFADGGERSAQRIVQKAAFDLGELVKSLMQPGMADREIPLVFAGGLLRKNSLLTYLLETRLSNDFPFIRIIKNGLEPHFGALRLAERGAGRTC